MKLMQIAATEKGLGLETDAGRIRLEPLLPGAIRVTVTGRGTFLEKESPVLAGMPKAPAPWRHEVSPETVHLYTEGLQLVIRRDTCAFTWLDAAGRLLTREPVRGGKVLEPFDVVRTVFRKDAAVTARQSVDGLRYDAGQAETVVDRTAYHAKLHFEWQPDEALYGLGSHEEGIYNLRGHWRHLYQQNMKASVPMLVSTRGYGVLFDNCGQMTFRDDEYGSYVWLDVADELQYVVIAGPTHADIVRRYRLLTGQVPMLPRWALGYFQSKERYKTQAELIDIVREHRARDLPLDCVVLDWLSWPEGQWGQKSFDPERFPDPSGMMDTLHGMGARLMISVWPNISAGGANHVEMREKGFMLGNRTTYDAFRAEARACYWQQAEEGLFRHGVDAWWCDSTEPFDGDWSGAEKPEPEERQRMNSEAAKKYLDPATICAYSLFHARGIHEGQRAASADKRVVNLTRSSWAGQSRYGTISWSGDIAATWDTLRKQIAEGMNFCATGEPWWTFDIGAFFVGGKEKWSYWNPALSSPAPWFLAGDYNDGCEDFGYRELYVRWFQMGAFLPVFRSHGTDTPREAWRFGEPGSIWYDTLKRFLELRYRLMPWLYSLAAGVSLRGETMLRLPALEFPQDAAMRDVADEFLLGPSLLVCPVTQPMHYGVNSTPLEGVPQTRRVRLPAGCDWYDFWTGERISGGTAFDADAPLSMLPVYVRAGTILPMGPVVQHTGEGLDAPLEVRVYPGADGAFTVYEDEGDGYGYEADAYALTELTWLDNARELRVGERKGAYPGMPAPREMRVVEVRPGVGVGL